MALPRRLLAVAVSAAAAGALLYLSTKRKQRSDRRGPIDESNDEKQRAEEERAERKQAEEQKAHEQKAEEKTAAPEKAAEGSSSAPAASSSGAQRELALFLAGDAWHDEIGWQALWDKEGVAAPDEWLRTKGREVLLVERKKLVEHPALLAGCRRRWIVVCRYAGIDVGDAAALWNASEII